MSGANNFQGTGRRADVFKSIPTAPLFHLKPGRSSLFLPELPFTAVFKVKLWSLLLVGELGMFHCTFTTNKVESGGW